MSIGDEPKPSDQKPKVPEGKEKIDLRILVAEDTPDIRDMLMILLGRRYTSVESVEDGLQLVNKLSTPGYTTDFVLTDNTMPNMRGIDAIKRIRDIEHLKTVPIILYTTDAQDGPLTVEADKLGAYFLHKPARSDEIYAAIEKLRTNK
ncbi:MAG: response regulator [Patescibacteria group bacterium]